MIGVRNVLAISLCTLSVACSAGQVDDTTGPDTTPVDTTGTGTVQRGTLTVRVEIDGRDQAIAAVAGVNLQGLTVRIERLGSTEQPRSAVTDASGAATFAELLQGTYTISVDRPLTPAEVAKLPTDERDIGIFAAGGQVAVVPPARAAIITLVAARRGSVVFSEFHNRTVAVGGPAYQFAHYFEIYNNSDTTVYLDGMLLVGRPPVPLGTQAISQPCATVNAEQRLDPDGIWVNNIFAFPGTGTTHPVQPGEARVIAVDAADHRFAGLPDLSRAQFEFKGTEADPDNPSAANMERIRGNIVANFGHGEGIAQGSLYALALPITRDTNDLIRTTINDRGKLGTVFRVPRAAILDAVGVQTTEAHEQFYGDFVACFPFAAPHFERSPARLMDPADPRPMRRRSLGRTADGREILQRTGTAARDFEQAAPLRRSLDK